MSLRIFQSGSFCSPRSAGSSVGFRVYGAPETLRTGTWVRRPWNLAYVIVCLCHLQTIHMALLKHNKYKSLRQLKVPLLELQSSTLSVTIGK